MHGLPFIADIYCRYGCKIPCFDVYIKINCENCSNFHVDPLFSTSIYFICCARRWQYTQKTILTCNTNIVSRQAKRKCCPNYLALNEARQLEYTAK